MTESKTIVITGASDGIGAAAAHALAKDGHEVVVVGRSPEKTKRVAEAIGANSIVADSFVADSFVADFGSLDEVRELAAKLTERYSRIDVLANNAGGVFGSRQKTVDGFEKTFQVNHLAPFLLTNLLLPTLISSGATVIQTASIAARLFGRVDISDLDNDRSYSANKAYGDSKLENILFTTELDRRYAREGISAAAFHPGIIGSSFATETTSRTMKMLYANPLTKLFRRSSEQGADQLIWLASTRPGTEWTSGKYYEKREVAKRVNPQIHDAALAERLWEKSAELCGLG